MKSIVRTIILLFPVLAAFSCTYRETGGITVPSGTLILTPAVADIVPAKSQLVVAENKLSEASVAVYHRGSLFSSTYVTDMSAISLPYLHIGDTYTAYAAFNCGNLTFPVAESDLSALTVTWNVSSIDTKGFPMTWSGSVTFSADGQNVVMEAGRMVSKVTFGISSADLTDHNGAFTASSVTLKNSVRTAGVFDAEIYGGDTSLSSDSATSADITSVNNGGRISFYTFENLGTAVGGISVIGSDPWNKVPDNMGGKGDFCTYLEVSGTYSTDGGCCTVPVTYRMYIGENAISNFDLMRNCVYAVTLCPSDEGIDRTSWKVTRGSFTDSRMLSFDPPSVTMNLNTSTTFKVIPDPSDMEYTVTGGTGWSGSTLTLTATGNPNEYSLSSNGTLSSDAVTSVVATSWDGRVTATLPVTVKAKTLKSISITPATVYKYTGGTQTYTVTATYDSGGTLTQEDVTSQTTFTVTGDENVVTMDKNAATAKDGGTATITASFGGKEAEAQFNTRYPVSAVVKLSASTISPGGSTTMTTTVTYSGDGAPKKEYTTASGLTYSFNPATSLASISGNTITAGGTGGDVYVRATYSEAGRSVTSAAAKLHIVVVSKAIKFEGLPDLFDPEIEDYNLATVKLNTLYDGAVQPSLEVTVTPSSVSSDNTDVATISHSGSMITIITKSTYAQTNIRATYNDSVYGTLSTSETIEVSLPEIVGPKFIIKSGSMDLAGTRPKGNFYVELRTWINGQTVSEEMVQTGLSWERESSSVSDADISYVGGIISRGLYQIDATKVGAFKMNLTYTGSANGKGRYMTTENYYSATFYNSKP